MQFQCLICGTECKLRKAKSTPTQLRKWQQKCPPKMDEDGLSWIFNLDIKGLDRESCVCRTCGRLLSDLEGYECLARTVCAELLQRHEAGRQGAQPLLVTDDELTEDVEPATPQLRRSGRRSGCHPSAAAAADPTAAAERRSCRHRCPPPLSVVQVKVETAAVYGDGTTTGSSSSRRRPQAAASHGAAVETEAVYGDGTTTGSSSRRRPQSAASHGAAVETAAASDGAAVETAAPSDGSDVVVSWADVEMKDESVEVVLEDSADDDNGSEGAEEGVRQDSGSDAASQYAPSLVADDSSDGGEASDGDADYQPRPAKRSSARTGLTCSRCGLGFKSRLGLVTHERRSHSADNEGNMCAICRKTFKHRGSLITHQRLVHGKGQRCRHCDVVFRCFYEYYRHLSDAHDIRTYVCEHCGAGFAKRVLLNRHLKKEARRIRQEQRIERLGTLKCSVCDYRPTIKRSRRTMTVYSMIKDHEHRAHGMHGALSTEPERAAAAGGSSAVSAVLPADDSDTAPDAAAAAAAAAASREEELITLTGGGEVAPPPLPEQRHPCGKCGLVFGCRRALVKHKTTHKERVEPAEPPPMVQCEYCGKEFSGAYLKTHQEVVHKIANLFYTCQYCGKQYHKYEKGHYISHLQTKHLMDRQFPCTEPACGRTFLHERGLRRHVRSIHQLGSPCGTCPERFGSLWKRDKHRAEVHGQYDFVCTECGLKFFRRAELETHTRRVHTLQLKYQCSVCSQRSEERRKLLNHEHSQHHLHAQPLPENNPAGLLAYPCPSAGCKLVFACGLVVKQHAWDLHQIKLDIYGKPKIPLSKRSVASLALPPDVIGPLVQ